jgi:la-related protein 1
VPSKSKD